MRKAHLSSLFQVCFTQIHLTFIALKLEMHRAWATGDGMAVSLLKHVRETVRIVYCGVELGDRFKRWHVVNLLIDMAKFGFGKAPAGKCNYRRVCEKGLPETRRDIERPNDLRHADGRPAGRAGKPIRHVDGGLLGMHM